MSKKFIKQISLKSKLAFLFACVIAILTAAVLGFNVISQVNNNAFAEEKQDQEAINQSEFSEIDGDEPVPNIASWNVSTVVGLPDPSLAEVSSDKVAFYSPGYAKVDFDDTLQKMRLSTSKNGDTELAYATAKKDVVDSDGKKYKFSKATITDTSPTGDIPSTYAIQYTTPGTGNLTWVYELEETKTTISFDANGGAFPGGTTPATVEATNGSDMPTIDDKDSYTPIREGYSFDGYYLNDENKLYYDDNLISMNPWDQDAATATLYAKWTPKTYEVTLNNSKIGVSFTIEVTYGQPIPDVDVPDAVGYIFNGYYDEEIDGTQYINNLGKSVKDWDKTDDFPQLYAQWTAKTYTITWNSAGAGAVTGGSTSYTIESATIDMPTNPSKTGYSFYGWNAEPTTQGSEYHGWPEIPFTDAPTLNGAYGDVTLTAQWMAVAYQITWATAGGTGGSGGDSTYTIESTSVNMNSAPTKEGATFKGWLASGATNWPSDPITTDTVSLNKAYGNVTLTAQWEAVQCTVTFDMQGHGGSTIPSQVVNWGSKVKQPPNPSEEGLVFGGWYKDSSPTSTDKWDFDNDVVNKENLTLFARWTLDEHTVTINTSEHGLVTLDPEHSSTYKTNEEVYLYVTADENYDIADWGIESGTITIEKAKEGSLYQYYFVMPSENVVLSPVFDKTTEVEAEVNTELGIDGGKIEKSKDVDLTSYFKGVVTATNMGETEPNKYELILVDQYHQSANETNEEGAVSLFAIPSEGNRFDGWLADGQQGVLLEGQSITFDEAKSFSAVFQKSEYTATTLTVKVNAEGMDNGAKIAIPEEIAEFFEIDAEFTSITIPSDELPLRVVATDYVTVDENNQGTLCYVNNEVLMKVPTTVKYDSNKLVFNGWTMSGETISPNSSKYFGDGSITLEANFTPVVEPTPTPEPVNPESENIDSTAQTSDSAPFATLAVVAIASAAGVVFASRRYKFN